MLLQDIFVEQVIQDGNSTTQYLVIGNANFMDARTTHASDVPSGSSKFFFYKGGYASASVTDKEMIINFLGPHGESLYQVESKPIQRNQAVLV